MLEVKTNILPKDLPKRSVFSLVRSNKGSGWQPKSKNTTFGTQSGSISHNRGKVKIENI